MLLLRDDASCAVDRILVVDVDIDVVRWQWITHIIVTTPDESRVAIQVHRYHLRCILYRERDTGKGEGIRKIEKLRRDRQ